MSVIISSNYKKHYKTYIDFVDHYWINYFKLKKISFFSLPNISNYKLEFSKYKIKLIILPGGNDLFSKDKISKARLKMEFDLIKYGLKKKFLFWEFVEECRVINLFFKGKQARIYGHMKTRHKIFFKTNFLIRK